MGLCARGELLLPLAKPGLLAGPVLLGVLEGSNGRDTGSSLLPEGVSYCHPNCLCSSVRNIWACYASIYVQQIQILLFIEVLYFHFGILV